MSLSLSATSIVSDQTTTTQVCPFCHKQIADLSLDEFRSHQLICEEANADDWVELRDGRWGRRKGSRLQFKFGPVKNGQLVIVRAEYCHACGQEHEASAPCPTLQRSWPRCRIPNCPKGREPHFSHTKVLRETISLIGAR